MEFICHYSTLGVAESASTQEIAAAYASALASFKRRLARGTPMPVERLDQLRVAYRTLTDPDSRQRHDDERARALAEKAVAVTTAADAKAPPPRIRERSDVAAAPRAPGSLVEFTGNGAEYLKIWLVNVALSLLTLGIYSAWAKVRREKYFHRNMLVDGAPLDYHGSPKSILKGRLVVAAFLLIASIAENVGPLPKLIVSVIGAVAFPWLIVQSMRFRARNTSYRGLRFSFSGSYWKALVLFLFHGSMTLVTLGFYFPIFLKKQKAFVAEHLSYGNQPLRFQASIGAFYHGLAFPLIVWTLLLAGLALFALITAQGALGPMAAMALVFLPAALILVANLLFMPYSRVVGTNLLWNHLALGGVRFRSTQQVRAYLGVALSNWLLVLLTLGFFWPQAQIRMARFRARNLFVLNPDEFAEIRVGAGHENLALGDEAMSAMDFEIAI